VSENLDLVRPIYAAWERGDFGGFDWADPTIEVVYADGPSPGTFTGLARMAEGMSEVVSAWDQFRVVPEEFCELDDERVLVLVHISGRGKTSGLDADQMRSSGLDLFHLRRARVTRIVVYWDRDRALADLGLEG